MFRHVYPVWPKLQPDSAFEVIEDVPFAAKLRFVNAPEDGYFYEDLSHFAPWPEGKPVPYLPRTFWERIFGRRH